MNNAWTVGMALTWGTRELTSPDNDSPRLDAESLLALALDLDRTSLFAHPELTITREAFRLYKSWIMLRKKHYPIQYIRGSQEFYGRDFIVNPGVLIPRPETELLVETFLALCGEHGPGPEPVRVLDIGTGSGCIAVTISAENPNLQVIATDIAPAAVTTARINAELLLDHDSVPAFFLSDLGSGLSPDSKFDFVLSNPPYVGFSESGQVDHSVRLHEPVKAVFSGSSGFECFRRIFPETHKLVKPEGYLLLEIGSGQAGTVENLGRENGWVLQASHADLAGITRCLVFSPLPE